MRRHQRTLMWLAAAVLVSVRCAALAGPDPATDDVAIFDATWREIDAHYPFFAYKHLDWDAEYARYRPQVAANSGSAALVTALCGMVSDLQSYHANLFTTPSNGCGYSGPKYPANFSRPLAESNIPGGIKPVADGVYRIGHATADIGYVAIPSFDGNGWGERFDDVLDALGAVRALVIDMRGNQGGNDGNGLGIAERLTDKTVVYQRTLYRNGPGRNDFSDTLNKLLSPAGHHFSGPVALLTNRQNGSAAEDFLTMMRVIPTVFTVGDTTIGNSSNPLWRELPNGWQLRIPQSMQMTPDGFVIEGRGLPPDVPVMLAPADSARGVDTILQRAIAELRRRLP